MSNKRSVVLWAASGVIGLLMGAAGDCYRNPDLGLWKLAAAMTAAGCFAQAYSESYVAEAVELQQLEAAQVEQTFELQLKQLDALKRLKMAEQEAEAQLQANQVLAEGKAETWFAREAGIPLTQTIDVPVQAQKPQALAAESVPASRMDAVVQSAEAIAAPVVVPAQPVALETLQNMQPATPAPAFLPDGAKLIEASEIADINQYPVVMVVAVPGSGKTVTVQWVVSQLPGKRVLCSHKAEAHQRQMFDLVFGYNPHNGESAWIGDSSTITTPDRDFTYIANQQQGYGTVAEGYWALFSEIKHRQKLGGTRAAQLPVYRNFFDEASYAYSTAFQDPLNPELLRWGQNLIGGTNKITFFDARTNRNQIFFAAQSDSVDIIGLKGLSAARDEMWFLYPGRGAIAYATQKGKQQLANWLTNRLSQGYAIAIMVKQDVFWHVINLPKVADLIAWEESFKVLPTTNAATQSAQHPEIYDLVQRVKQDAAA